MEDNKILHCAVGHTECFQFHSSLVERYFETFALKDRSGHVSYWRKEMFLVISCSFVTQKTSENTDSQQMWPAKWMPFRQRHSFSAFLFYVTDIFPLYLTSVTSITGSAIAVNYAVSRFCTNVWKVCVCFLSLVLTHHKSLTYRHGQLETILRRSNWVILRILKSQKFNTF